MKLRAIRSILCLSLLFAIYIGGFCAQPRIKAVMVEQPPVLDGDLSDACWQQAPSVDEFFFPTDGTKAAEPTTVWLCYDQTSIYMAFRCKDSQPGKIIAQQKKRGGDIGTDDWVGFDLDCYNKYTHISWFDVSAGGVQVERLQTGDVSKIEWKGDWNAAAKRLPDGYAVEIAIPWSILQYDASHTSMGIAFIRRHARTEQWWWAPNVGPNTDARNFYLWEGLQLPRPRIGPQFMAYSLFGSGEGSSAGSMGVDMKYALTPSLTSIFTANPDFRNVEQSVDSVDFSYNERYLPDSRPFFQEGKSHFPESNIYYTRRIRNIDTGLSLSGRYGDYGIAAMHADHFGEEHHNVVQVSRQWGDHTWAWLCGIESYVPKEDGLPSENTVGYFVMNQVLAGHGENEIKASASYATAGSPGNHGDSYSASVHNRSRPRVLGWSVGHTVTAENYFPYLGLVGDTGIRDNSLYLSTYDELSKGPVTEWYTGVDLWRTDRYDGSPFINGMSLYYEIDFRSGTGAWLNMSKSRRDAYHDRNLGVGYSWGGRDLYKHGSVNMGFGRLANGDHLYWSVSQGWQINDRLSMQGSYEFARITKPSPEAFCRKQLITSLVYDFDPEHTLVSRLVSRDGKPNVYLAYRQRVRRGTDAYVIFGDPNAESTRSSFALKLIRMF